MGLTTPEAKGPQSLTQTQEVQLLPAASPPEGAGLLPRAWLGGCRAEQGRRPAHPHNLACSGLCGNFNGDTTDDLTSSMGVAEGTASLFVDSWRAGNGPTALERETDPCSMSQLNSEQRALEGCGVGGRPRLARQETHRACPRRGVCRDPLCGAGEQGHGV